MTGGGRAGAGPAAGTPRHCTPLHPIDGPDVGRRRVPLPGGPCVGTAWRRPSSSRIVRMFPPTAALDARAEPMKAAATLPHDADAPRRFVDVEGCHWAVVEGRTPHAAGGPPALASQRAGSPLAWLVFVGEGETRLLREFPAQWRALTDEGLDALCRRAERVWPPAGEVAFEGPPAATSAVRGTTTEAAVDGAPRGPCGPPAPPRS